MQKYRAYGSFWFDLEGDANCFTTPSQKPIEVYFASDVDAAITELRDTGQKVDDELAAKDRDLADANHALLLANNSADAFRRVAEQRQGEIERLRRAVEWCLQLGVTKTVGRLLDHYDAGLIVPAEFVDILKPTTGASNG